MSRLINRHTHSGLVLAEQASDEAAVSRALNQMDDRLYLWPPDGMSAYYRVVRRWSDEHDVAVIVTWMDPATGDPLPLSSGILDEVQKWRPENRDKRGPDADEINRLREENARRLQDEHGQQIKDEHAAKIDRGQVSVSLGAKTKKPSWQRNTHFPERIRELTK